MSAPGPSVASPERDGNDTDRRRLRLHRDLDGSNRAEAFLAAAVVAVLGIRALLAATGYPQAGGGKLHIAHMLWGGVLMLVAMLMLLMLSGTQVRLVAALVGGAGFGTFIDELGKFLTQDNDYFFKPAIALIYTGFVTVFLLVRAFPHRPPSRSERLAYGYAALTDLALGKLTDRHRRRALALLPESTDQDHDHEQCRAVRALLASPQAPVTPPSRLRRLTRSARAAGDRLRDLAGSRPVRRGVTGLFFLLAGSSVAAVVLAFVRGGDLTPPLTVTNVGSALSALAVGLLSLLGITHLVRGARRRALTSFYRATQVSIFFLQFFAFVAVQLLALAGLVVNVAVLVALRAQLAGGTDGEDETVDEGSPRRPTGDRHNRTRLPERAARPRTGR